MDIKRVKEYKDGVVINDNLFLPTGNTGHIREVYNIWLAEGNYPQPEHTQVELDEIKAWEERAWRNEQLNSADIEINKLADNLDIKEKDWRDYRIVLRDYPEQPDFPKGLRPVAPK